MARNGVPGDPLRLIPSADSGERRGDLQNSHLEASVRSPADYPIASEIRGLVNLRITCSWCGDLIQAGIPGGGEARGLMCSECVKGFANLACCENDGANCAEHFAPGVGR